LTGLSETGEDCDSSFLLDNFGKVGKDELGKDELEIEGKVVNLFGLEGNFGIFLFPFPFLLIF
tara:strand:+ start:382 stop:570 length:189 start_codon:yes stop_codon:yes gene_type:complete